MLLGNAAAFSTASHAVAEFTTNGSRNMKRLCHNSLPISADFARDCIFFGEFHLISLITGR
jgi:hypothetical protein